MHIQIQRKLLRQSKFELSIFSTFGGRTIEDENDFLSIILSIEFSEKIIEFIWSCTKSEYVLIFLNIYQKFWLLLCCMCINKGYDRKLFQ